MPIPNPTLDDLTFEQLVEEARKSIPFLTKSWTNYNLSDPGITLLELFAWLTENQVYSLNKITTRNFLMFLKLLGIKPLDAVAPKIDLTIFISRDSADKGKNISSFCLPKHTHFTVKQEEVFVETEVEFFIIPSLQIKRCIVYSKNQYSEIRLLNPRAFDNTLTSVMSSTSAFSPKTTLPAESNPQDSVDSEPHFFLFGEDPEPEDCFYLQIEFSSKDVKRGDDISLSFYLFERDLPLIGQHGLERPECFIDKGLKSELLWEYAHFTGVESNAGNNSSNRQDKNHNTERSFGAGDNTSIHNANNGRVIWFPLEMKQDSTFSFSQSGRVTFRYPTDGKVEKSDLFQHIPITRLSTFKVETVDQSADDIGQLWIRCKIIKNSYQLIPPRIEYILPNTVSGSIGYTLKQNLKNMSQIAYGPKSHNANLSDDNVVESNNRDYQELSNGLSNQVFELEGSLIYPVLKLNYLTVNSEKWVRVDDLISSHPLDRHYVVLDESKGRVKFGDGENGRVPPKGSIVEIEYKSGKMQSSWIDAGKRFTIEDPRIMKEIFQKSGKPNPRFRLFAVNCFPSSFGRKAETIREAIARARQELVIPFKAVTRFDCEYIAKNTPGLRVGKVRAITSKRRGEENTLIIVAAPYSLSSSVKRSGTSLIFQDEIRKHIESHKLITTDIRMIQPKYVGVTVSTRIKLGTKNPVQINAIKKRIASSLHSYFSPLSVIEPAARDDGGWDFGRNVYRSNIIAILESLQDIDAVSELRLDGSGGGFHRDAAGNLIVDELNLVYLKDIFISVI